MTHKALYCGTCLNLAAKVGAPSYPLRVASYPALTLVPRIMLQVIGGEEEVQHNPDRLVQLLVRAAGEGQGLKEGAGVFLELQVLDILHWNMLPGMLELMQG